MKPIIFRGRWLGVAWFGSAYSLKNRDIDNFLRIMKRELKRSMTLRLSTKFFKNLFIFVCRAWFFRLFVLVLGLCKSGFIFCLFLPAFPLYFFLATSLDFRAYIKISCAAQPLMTWHEAGAHSSDNPFHFLSALELQEMHKRVHLWFHLDQIFFIQRTVDYRLIWLYLCCFSHSSLMLIAASGQVRQSTRRAPDFLPTADMTCNCVRQAPPAWTRWASRRRASKATRSRSPATRTASRRRKWSPGIRTTWKSRPVRLSLGELTNMFARKTLALIVMWVPLCSFAEHCSIWWGIFSFTWYVSWAPALVTQLRSVSEHNSNIVHGKFSLMWYAMNVHVNVNADRATRTTRSPRTALRGTGTSCWFQWASATAATTRAAPSTSWTLSTHICVAGLFSASKACRVACGSTVLSTVDIIVCQLSACCRAAAIIVHANVLLSDDWWSSAVGSTVYMYCLWMALRGCYAVSIR